MKILEKEIGLREETRAAEQAKKAIEESVYTQRAADLADTQHEILEMTDTTMQAILDLQKEKDASFPKELQLLTHVGQVMSEVEGLLREPETGPETIAAQTEIIEMLLQVQRQQPPKKNTKGASGNKPNGGGEGDTDESALALLGRGDESNAGTAERETDQATGTAGSAYPAEFRTGLDAYFSDLEK